jgi:hypothetical protein
MDWDVWFHLVDFKPIVRFNFNPSLEDYAVWIQCNGFITIFSIFLFCIDGHSVVNNKLIACFSLYADITEKTLKTILEGI